ncbi:MAG TPA: winged helix-turn-helix domain-containing protein, partial [Acidobacteriota bacterium]|nr:winged helix-turn-helix domain-containing protein [Acidobacteriota bacterium]
MFPPEKLLYEFSDFHLNIPERLLTRQGQRIPLPEKAFETLCVLVQEAGHLVTKKDLMSRVWPDTFVEENSLDKSVSLLRQVLGDRNGQQKFIETVRGHGYRFIADVKRAQAETVVSSKTELAADIEISARPALPASLEASRNFRKSYVVILFALILSIVVVWQFSKSRKEQPQLISSKQIHSLAVLPLKNLSPASKEEYFANGMTEELITKLAQITSIRVISHTSVMEYKNSRKSISEIAQELNVDAILEGSVLHAGNRVRISTQLIDGATDAHLWAYSYERDFQDILTLQNQVAVAVATEVQAKLKSDGSPQFANAPKVNPEA